MKKDSGKNDVVVLLFLLVSAICYSMGPNGYKELVKDGLSPAKTVGWFLVAGGLCTIPFWVRDKGLKIFKEISCLRPWMILILLLDTVLSVTYFLLFILSMNLGTIANTTLVSRLSPVFVVILATIVLREKFVHGQRCYSRSLYVYSGSP